MDDCRKEFERWYNNPDLVGRFVDGRYEKMVIDGYWRTWKAGWEHRYKHREALGDSAEKILADCINKDFDTLPVGQCGEGQGLNSITGKIEILPTQNLAICSVCGEYGRHKWNCSLNKKQKLPLT